MILRRFKYLVFGAMLWPAFSFASEDIFSQVKQANITAVGILLQQDKSLLEARNTGSYTPLLIAAQHNDVAMVKFLLKQGADVNAMNNKHRDILNIAISERNPEIARIALQEGADPSLVTSIYAGSALIYATHQSQLEIMAMLISAGAPLNRVNNLGWTALLEATVLGDGSKPYVQAVKMLLEAGADKDVADKNGKKPLDHARDRGHQKLIDLLKG